jgi:hypothetical protein
MSLRRFLHLCQCENGHHFVEIAATWSSCPLCDTWEWESIDCWLRGQPPWGGRLASPKDVTNGADTPAAFLAWLSYCMTSEHPQAPHGVRWVVPGVTQDVQDNRWVWLPCLAAS